MLIDADATDAQVTRLFDLEGRSGLADIAPGTERNAANHLVPIAGMLQIMPRGRSEPTEDDDAAHVSGTLAALARGTDLVVVSTGPLHLSVALERPVIGLYGYLDPKRVGPYRKYQDLLIDAHRDSPDEPMTTEQRRDRMRRISVRDVLDRVERWQKTYASSSGPKV